MLNGVQLDMVYNVYSISSLLIFDYEPSTVLGFEVVKGVFVPQNIPLDMLTGVQLYRVYNVYSVSCLLVFDYEPRPVLDYEVAKEVLAPQTYGGVCRFVSAMHTYLCN